MLARLAALLGLLCGAASPAMSMPQVVCTPEVPRVILSNPFGSPVVFSWGGASGAGVFAQSGTLAPGTYELYVVTNEVTSGLFACHNAATVSASLTLGAPASIVSAARDTSVHTGCASAAASSNLPDDCHQSLARACDTPLPCPNGPCVGFALASLDVTMAGSPTAPTGWTMRGFGRTTMANSPLAYNQGVCELRDRFTVTAPTTYNASADISWVGIVPSAPPPPSTQTIPVLPDAPSAPGGGGGWDFYGHQSGEWYDPPAAYGFRFTMLGGSRFTQILAFPIGLDADDHFVVHVAGQAIGTFSVTDTVDFVALTGSAVSTFEIYGIEPLVSGDSPIAFPIRLAFDTLAADFTMSPLNAVPASAFCLGDGTGVSCPCGNNGATGNGCANSLFPSGAQLVATGTTSVAADTASLNATNMTGSIAVFFQGGTQIPAAVVDDGIGCVGGPVIRLGAKPLSMNSSSYPQSGDTPISVRGAIPPAGGTRYYQCFYRNAVSAFCPPATSNRTNGVAITWTL